MAGLQRRSSWPVPTDPDVRPIEMSDKFEARNPQFHSAVGQSASASREVVPEIAGPDESGDRYVDLYEFAPIGYLILTPDGLIAKINHTGCTLLGVDRPIQTESFASFVVHEDRDRWAGHFMGLL